MVYEIKKANPDLEIIINGGITKVSEINDHMKFCDGVMIGRSIYQNPYSLVEIEKEIFKTNDNPSREEVVCLLYTSPSPRDVSRSRMPSSA